jgi:ATP-dependent DNA helicase RecG
VAKGRQAYWVCPLVEESDALDTPVDLTAATTMYERTRAELPHLRWGLLHGQMPPAEKAAVMALFARGDIDVLVATTVIEVGVDVPEATVMVVLDAERFGIAQLHQLRGRVGRGTAASRCILLSAAPPGPEGAARLEALVRTQDGFELAEVDLDLRGEGTVMGERQRGRSDLRLASLRRDRVWVERAREVASELIDERGEVLVPALAEELRLLDPEDEAFLTKS